MGRLAPRVCSLVALGILGTGGCDKLSGLLGDDGEGAETPAAGAETDGAASADSAPDSDAAPPTPASADRPGSSGGGGPELAWQIELPQVPRQILLDPRGTMAVVFDGKITGLHDGLEVWTKDGDFGEVIRLADGSMVATRGAEVVAFEPGDGSERFVVAPPVEAADPNEEPPPQVVGVARFGSQVLIATGSAEFFVVDPPTCQGKEPGCIRPAGSLEGEYLEPSARLAVGDDGTRFLVEDKTVRAFDIALETLFRVDAYSPVVAVVPVGDHLAMSFGGEAALLDVGRCRARGEFSIGRRGSSAPARCIRWRYAHDLDAVAPAVLDLDTIAVNGSRRLQAVADGDDLWKIPIGSVGPVLTDGQGLLFTITADDTGASMALEAVSAHKATVEWMVPLPISVPDGEAIDPATLLFDRSNTWLAAGLARRIAMLELPGEIPGSER